MIRKIYLWFIPCFLFKFVAPHEDTAHTVQYSADKFDDAIAKKNHFVMFFAPWCGHCQRLSPTWEQLAEMLNEDDSQIKIAKVDCTTDSSVCSAHDVTGYPTLKFFRAGEKDGVKFRGTRDLPSLTTFINEQLRLGDEEKSVPKVPEPVNKLKELTEETFNEHVASGKHFVKFYAPWCGHCQKLAPVWEELAESLEFEPSVSIARIDCTQSRTICNNFAVKGYPTLLWIEDGKKIEKFQGQRTHEELKAYVNKMLGSSEQAAPEEEETVENADDTVSALTLDSFYHGIQTGVTFVKFYAPWCGHCKRLASTWEELGRKFLGTSGVKIMKVDCTLEENKQLCSEEEVDGFPTLYLYKDGDKIAEHTGSRNLAALYEFVKKYIQHDEL